ncbi:MAG TPA: hypothetical protein VMH81_15190 [Bryobacteraceae bacterium]|nr:hypothetical protein [Bryobacteraceae bacterium]
MRKTTILIVSTPALSRIIMHLFRGRSEFEVVGTLSSFECLGQQAGRLLPELIVADVKPVSIRISRAVASIKRFSPISKLILICPVGDLARAARQCGADACLSDARLTGHLVRTARSLREQRRLVNAGD